MKNYYWIELIGFDKENKELTVKNFIDKQNGKIDKVFLLLYNIDFVNSYKGMGNEYYLKQMECSYAGHIMTPERKIQKWTNYDLKELISIFHYFNIEVYFSVFNNSIGRSENGIEEGEFCSKHNEIYEYCSKTNTLSKGNVHLLKKLNDGTLFEDYFCQKLKEVLVDYNFDGFHMADGLSSPRTRLCQGDFSDNIVNQFEEYYKGLLPEKYLNCKTNTDFSKRYNYIMSNLRYEWTTFFSKRFEQFILKTVNSIHLVNKKVCINNVWTCSPFEALFRYGIDYNSFLKANVDEIMFEDATAQAISSWFDLAVEMEEDTRWYSQIRYLEKQRSLCTLLSRSTLNMTSIHDTQEDWDILNNAPNELRSTIARRESSFYWYNGKMNSCCNGSVFCLSDCISKYQWDEIHKIVEMYKLPNIKEDIGFTALNNGDIYVELNGFINTRRLHSGLIRYYFQKNGLSITSFTDENNLSKSKGPLIVCDDNNLSKSTIDYIENNNDRIILYTTYGNGLNKEYSAKFTCGDFNVYLYNMNKFQDKVYRSNKSVSLSYKDSTDDSYLKLPRHNKITEKLFIDVVDLIKRQNIFPYIIAPYECLNDKGKPSCPREFKKADCTVLAYIGEDNKKYITVLNNENKFAFVVLKLPFDVTSARFMDNNLYKKPNINNKNTIGFKIVNRGAVVLVLE